MALGQILTWGEEVGEGDEVNRPCHRGHQVWQTEKEQTKLVC